MKGQPNEIDSYVGKRLRALRETRGLSQQYLGACVGVSCQQVQKYEHAVNRIGASRLANIARTLGVSVNYFYDGLPPRLFDLAMQDVEAIPALDTGLVLSSEAKKLLGAFEAILSQKEREAVIFLCETLAKLNV